MRCLFAILTLPALALAAAPSIQQDLISSLNGKVLETMDSSGYTYMLVQQAERKTWVAVKQTKVAVGDQVRVADGWMMKDFESKTLKRKFDWIVFASGVEINGKRVRPTGTALSPGTALPPGHPVLTNAPRVNVPIEVKPGTIQKAPGGYTVAECYAQKKKLAGQTIQVRGMVVKFNSNIMGKNWAHIRDGTGADDANDLTITTAATVNPGDTIVAKGRLIRDKDFGSGYKYSVLLEDAVITQP